MNEVDYYTRVLFDSTTKNQVASWYSSKERDTDGQIGKIAA